MQREQLLEELGFQAQQSSRANKLADLRLREIEQLRKEKNASTTIEEEIHRHVENEKRLQGLLDQAERRIADLEGDDAVAHLSAENTRLSQELQIYQRGGQLISRDYKIEQLKSQIRLFEMRVRAHEDDEMKLKEQVAFLEKTVVRLKDECLQIENLKWRAEEERNSLACEARRNRMMMDHDDMSKNSASTTVQSKKQSPQKDDWLKGAASALSSPGSAQAVQEYAAALRMSKDDESKLRSSEASCASGVASVPSPRHARVILCAPFAHKESAEASPGERGGADMHMSLSHESVVPAFGIATARVSLQHASLALDGSASSTECERKGSVSTPSHPQAQYPDMNWVVTVSDPVVSLVVSEDHQHAPPSIHCISMHPGSEPGAEAGSEPGAEVGSHCSSDAVHWTECSCSHVCADGCDVVTADFSTTPRGEQRAYFETVLPPTMGIPTRDGVVGAHRVHAASSDYHGGHHHHHHEDHHQKECSLFPVGRMRLSATSHQHMHHNQATASELQNEAARVATELNDAVAHSRHSAGAAAPLLLLLPPSDGVFTGTNWTDAHRLASGAGAGVAFGGASKHVQERQAFEWGSLVNRAGGAAGLAKPPLGGSVSRPPIAASAAAAAARAPQHAVHALPSGTGGASRPLIPKLSLATLGGEGEAVPLGGVGASSFRSQVSASSFRPQVSASSIGGNFVSPRFHQLSRTPDEECLREGAHNLAHNAGFVSARLPNAAEVDYDKASFEGRSRIFLSPRVNMPPPSTSSFQIAGCSSASGAKAVQPPKHKADDPSEASPPSGMPDLTPWLGKRGRGGGALKEKGEYKSHGEDSVHMIC